MIIEEHKAVFIHIPKNAGTSIETLFANNSFKIQPYKHANIHEIKKKFPEVYNSYRKFTIIRNPYDKMVSWYFYLKKQIGENHKIIEFSKWIKEPSKLWHINDPTYFLDPQHTWLDDTVTLIKYENLDEELNQFFGEDINLPITNKSDHNHFTSYYDKESSNIIYNRYKEDFEKYNYKKL
tara:strand:+ start:108 stop:647 length:540 start_codon:yes stop_codon:yes gene_type:complete